LNRSLRIQIPLFILIRTLLNTTVRMVYPFLPVFGRGLGVDLSSLSQALSLRSAAGLLGPFLASAVDNRDRKTGMLLGIGLCVVGFGVLSIWPGYITFVIALMLGVIGNIVFSTAMQAYLGERTPYQRRGLVLAFTELGWSASFFLGMPLVGYLIARSGWKAPFSSLAAVGMLVFAITLILLPKSPPQTASINNAWGNLRQVFTNPIALGGLTLGFSISGANELVNLIFGVWIEDSFGVKIAMLAAASLVIGIGELLGEILSGGLAYRLGKARAVRAGLVLNCLGALALPWLGRSLNGALAGLFLFYITFEFTVVCAIPMLTEVLPAARATLMASYIASAAMGRAAGDLLSPILYRQTLGPLSGMHLIGLAVVALNLAAMIALRFLRRVEPAAE
jgi:DHA1 family inner membrane transport protein